MKQANSKTSSPLSNTGQITSNQKAGRMSLQSHSSGSFLKDVFSSMFGPSILAGVFLNLASIYATLKSINVSNVKKHKVGGVVSFISNTKEIESMVSFIENAAISISKNTLGSYGNLAESIGRKMQEAFYYRGLPSNAVSEFNSEQLANNSKLASSDNEKVII